VSCRVSRQALGLVVALVIARNHLAYRYLSYWPQTRLHGPFITVPYLQLGAAPELEAKPKPEAGSDAALPRETGSAARVIPGRVSKARVQPEVPAPTSLLLCWEVPVPDGGAVPAWAVEVESPSGPLVRVTRAPVSQRVALAGLAPYDAYTSELPVEPGREGVRYRVLRAGKVVFEATARPPRPRGAPAHFAVFGDCGTGGRGQKALAPVIARAHPDLLCIPGDVVYTYGRVVEYRSNYDAIYNSDATDPTVGAPLLRSIPSVASTGNHDFGYSHRSQGNLDTLGDCLGYYLRWHLPLNGPLVRAQAAAARLGCPPDLRGFLATPAGAGTNKGTPAGASTNKGTPAGASTNQGTPAGAGTNKGTPAGGDPYPLLEGAAARQRAFREACGARFPRMANYSFDYGNTHWTVLDSNERVDWHDPELRRWLIDDLAAARGAAWRFVMYHHPPYHSSARHAECTQMRSIAGILERGGVSVVWCGHVHDYQRQRPLSVLPPLSTAPSPSPELASPEGEAELLEHPRIDTQFDGQSKTHAQGVLYVVSGQGGYRGGLERLSTSFARRPWSDVWHMERPSFTDLWTYDDHLEVRQIDDQGHEIDRFRLDLPQRRVP
jgi:3',5'-cyclic AMP phosphodiesterase CpdA